MTAHAALRDFTRGAHDRLDQRFSTLNLAERGDYGQFLCAHASAFLPLETALEQGGAAQLLPDWDEIKRGEALKSDLRAMSLSLPEPEVAPKYMGKAELLGGLYVLEGSRLGGKLLRKVLGEGLPAQFLSSDVPPGHWRMFLSMLNELISPDEDRVSAQAAAARTFACFDHAAQRILGQ